MATTKILIIGGTGFLGKFMVEASAKAGHSTFALVRESSLSDPIKSSIIQKFNALGVNVVLGDIHDHKSLVRAIKQVDVVICVVNHLQINDQYKLIYAIKEAGNVKRFFPSEFGHDVDRTHALDEGKNLFDTKAQIRRTIEAQGIPHTYVVANSFIGHYLPTWSDLGPITGLIDSTVILGDGKAKAVLNTEKDIATYTIRSVDDPRTLNKILYIKPPANIISYNDLVSLWEKKHSKNLKRVYVPEVQVLKYIEESSFPFNMAMSICHAAYVKGDHTNYEIEPSFGVEASELYPDIKYTTLEEFFNHNDSCTPFYLNRFILVNGVQNFY
ncbi:isoflavone reductase homolog PCBER [Cajanus cajan]|uniref:Isoflavone reductase isogeny n=1 Tax=Cajanus cajan TaxID=3821 RepID=A0A151TGC5_CAJCA|nr:isoflavone reductase homolog PCBER [Cajanus cajan]KYP66089.1 Isoflavone reductase isogeny [Cajanus cajan]